MSDYVRDYTVHLRVRSDREIDVDALDEVVRDVVDASTAREAISVGVSEATRRLGLVRGRGLDQVECEADLENLYVVSATRPEGGIE